MKKFNFPLERVLRWRETQVRLEEAKLDQLREQLRVLDQRRESLGASVMEAQTAILESTALTAAEIGALEHYRSAAATQDAALRRDRHQVEQMAAQQLTKVLERRREARLLERLREQRMAEWRAAEALEVEQLAAEFYLARRVRENTHGGRGIR